MIDFKLLRDCTPEQRDYRLKHIQYIRLRSSFKDSKCNEDIANIIMSIVVMFPSLAIDESLLLAKLVWPYSQDVDAEFFATGKQKLGEAEKLLEEMKERVFK